MLDLIASLSTMLPYPRYTLPASAIALTALLAIAVRRRLGGFERILVCVLAGVAALAFLDYTKVHWKSRRYFNYYEFYHYYLGTKYAPELGYTRLYGAVIAAQGEQGRTAIPGRVRDLATNKRVPVSRVLARADEYKAHFSEHRWREFTEDVLFFRSHVGPRTWQKMVLDKGYNSSPVTTTVSGTLANAVQTPDRVGMHALAAIDAVLMAGAFATVAWAFGLRTMLLVFLLFATHYVTSMFVLKSAFFRLDWIACLLAAVSMLKKNRHTTAGALTAYAAMVRVFPAIFAFGLGAKFLHALLTRRVIEWKQARYLLAFIATAGILFAVSIGYGGGLASWREFVDSIRLHDSVIAEWRVGFKYVFLMGWDDKAIGGGSLVDFFGRWRWVYFCIAAVSVGFWYRLVQSLEDWESQAATFVIAFFLVAPTYYYYVMLVLPCLWFAARIEERSMAAGLAYMFAVSIVTHALYLRWDRGRALFFVLSCLVMVQVIYMMVLAGRRRAPPPLPAST